jgi:hypothetical protein
MLKTKDEILNEIEDLSKILSLSSTEGHLRTVCLSMFQTLLWVIGELPEPPCQLLAERYNQKIS